MRYVALPDVALDPTGRAEGALIRGGLPYLRPVHRSRHWAIYEVLGTPGLTDGVGRLTRLGPQSFALDARAARLHARAGALHALLEHRSRARVRDAQRRRLDARLRPEKRSADACATQFDPRRLVTGTRAARARRERLGARCDVP